MSVPYHEDIKEKLATISSEWTIDNIKASFATAANGNSLTAVNPIPESKIVDETITTLKTIYEICNARIEFNEILLEWINEANLPKLKTYCQKKHPTLLPIPTDIKDLRKELTIIVNRYVEKYTHLREKIASGINQDDIDDLYFYIKEVAFRKHSYLKKKDNLKKRINSVKKVIQEASEEMILRFEILSKLKPLLSDDAKTLLNKNYIVDMPPQGTCYDFDRVLSLVDDALSGWASIFPKFKMQLHNKSSLLMFEEINLAVDLNRSLCEIAKKRKIEIFIEVEEYKKIVRVNPKENLFVLFKNIYHKTQFALAPIIEKTDYFNQVISAYSKFVDLAEISKKEVLRIPKILSLIDKLSKFGSSLNSRENIEIVTQLPKLLNSTLDDFTGRSFVITNDFTVQRKKTGMEKIKGIQSCIIHFEVLTSSLTVMLNNYERHIHDKIRLAEEGIKQKQMLQLAENNTATAATITNSSADMVPTPIRLSKPISPMMTTENWTKQIEERRLQKARVAVIERLKAAEEIRLEVQRKKRIASKIYVAIG